MPTAIFLGRTYFVLDRQLDQDVVPENFYPVSIYEYRRRALHKFLTRGVHQIQQEVCRLYQNITINGNAHD